MKWWICLAALVLALTTSAGASDLPADLELTRDRRQETEKRSAALWLSGAALLVILLI